MICIMMQEKKECNRGYNREYSGECNRGYFREQTG